MPYGQLRNGAAAPLPSMPPNIPNFCSPKDRNMRPKTMRISA
jgi:hypothetical protein